MVDLSTFSLHSDKLSIEPISQHFAKEIFKEFTPELTKYMFPRPAKNIEETKHFIQSAIDELTGGKELIVVILCNPTREFLGCGGIHRVDTPTPELGIWIKEDAHGNGYGKEAISLLKAWLDNTKTYEYITYPVDKRNIPSRKIAESLGGKVMKEYTKKNQTGNILNEVEYWIYKNNH